MDIISKKITNHISSLHNKKMSIWELRKEICKTRITHIEANHIISEMQKNDIIERRNKFITIKK